MIVVAVLLIVGVGDMAGQGWPGDEVGLSYYYYYHFYFGIDE
jgi:hypothetical protein